MKLSAFIAIATSFIAASFAFAQAPKPGEVMERDGAVIETPDAEAPAQVEALVATAGEGVELPSPDKFLLILLTGQSNMAGRGAITDENKTLNPRVLMLDKNMHWVVAKDPVHFDKRAAGAGLARPFAERLAADHPDCVVGLVPVACGGSSLTEWLPGKFCNSTQTYPFDDAMKRIDTVAGQGTWTAILFHQGESDTSKNADKYYDLLTAHVKALREKLDAPQVPVVIGELARWDERPTRPGNIKVTEAHRKVAEEQQPAAFVSSADLTPNPDRVHFDAKSVKIFGRRYYEAFKALGTLPVSENNDKE